MVSNTVFIDLTVKQVNSNNHSPTYVIIHCEMFVKGKCKEIYTRKPSCKEVFIALYIKYNTHK